MTRTFSIICICNIVSKSYPSKSLPDIVSNAPLAGSPSRLHLPDAFSVPYSGHFITFVNVPFLLNVIVSVSL